MALVTVQRSPTPNDSEQQRDFAFSSPVEAGASDADESLAPEADGLDEGDRTACFSPVSEKAAGSVHRSRYFAVKGAAVILSSPVAASSLHMCDAAAAVQARTPPATAAGRDCDDGGGGGEDEADVGVGAAAGQVATTPRMGDAVTHTQPAVRPQSSANAGEIQQHLQAMLHLLRPQDTLKMAVRLESALGTHTRYMAIVCAGDELGDQAAVVGIDYVDPRRTTVGLVLPIWASSVVGLDGDGGITVESQSVCTGGGPAGASTSACSLDVASTTLGVQPAVASCSQSSSCCVLASLAHSFKPVSVQAMWSAYQALHREHAKAIAGKHLPGAGTHHWLNFYHDNVNSPESFRSEWHWAADGAVPQWDDGELAAEAAARFRPVRPERAKVEKCIRQRLKEIMQTVDLDEVTSKDIRERLESRMERCLREYKSFIDREMLVILGQMDKPSKIFDYLYLGTEWNASNWDELNANGVRYILNVTKEVDNFFPGLFNYMKIRVSDEESAELLKHWDLTYKFVNQARDTGSAVLVHCKKGISRSSSTVIAYAMKEFGWSVDDALSYVKSKRNIITPNKGFVRQLRTYNGILDASRNRNSALFNNTPKSNDMVHSASTAGPLLKSRAATGATAVAPGLQPVLSTPQIHCRPATVTRWGRAQAAAANVQPVADCGRWPAVEGGRQRPGGLLVASENILKAVPHHSQASGSSENVTSLEVPGWDDTAAPLPMPAPGAPLCVADSEPCDVAVTVGARLPAVGQLLRRRESAHNGQPDGRQDDCTLKRMQNLLVRRKRHSNGSAGAASSSSGASSLLESDSSLDMSASDDERRLSNSFGVNVRYSGRPSSRSNDERTLPGSADCGGAQTERGRHVRGTQSHHHHQQPAAGAQWNGRRGSKHSVKSAAADSAVADLGPMAGGHADHHALQRTQSSHCVRQQQPHSQRAGNRHSATGGSRHKGHGQRAAAAAAVARRPNSMTCLQEEGRAGQHTRMIPLGDFTPVPGQVKRTAVTYEMRQQQRRLAEQDGDESAEKSSDSGAAVKQHKPPKRLNAGRKFFERFFPPKKQADAGDKQQTATSKWYQRKPSTVHEDKTVDSTSPAPSHSVFYHHYQPTPLLAAAQRATGASPSSRPYAHSVNGLPCAPGDRHSCAAPSTEAHASTGDLLLTGCRSDENLVRSLVGVFERSYDATHESLEPHCGGNGGGGSGRASVRFTLGEASQNCTPVKPASVDGQTVRADKAGDVVRASRALTFN